MHPYILVGLIACLGYGLENALIDKYLAEVHPMINVGVRCLVILAVTVPFIAWQLYGNNEQSTMPRDIPWRILVLMGVVAIAADLCFFGAYSLGARIPSSGITIGVLILTIPIFIAMFNAIIGGARPATGQVVGWLIVAVGISVAAYFTPTTPTNTAQEVAQATSD